MTWWALLERTKGSFSATRRELGEGLPWTADSPSEIWQEKLGLITPWGQRCLNPDGYSGTINVLMCKPDPCVCVHELVCVLHKKSGPHIYPGLSGFSSGRNYRQEMSKEKGKGDGREEEQKRRQKGGNSDI